MAILKRDTSDQGDLFDDEFLQKLEYLYVVSRKIITGDLKAERKKRKVGSGIEFADHRRYTWGDDFRYIDWNLYGRIDKLLLRLFEEEEDLHIYLLIDCSRSMSMGTPAKIYYAKKLCAALAYIGLAHLDRVAIIPFSDRLHDRLPPARGKGRIFKVFEFLRNVHTDGVTNLTECLNQFVHQMKRRGLVVVLSDYYDTLGFSEGLNTLRYQKFEPFVLQIYDQWEVNPKLQGDITLIDCETKQGKEVTITPKILAAYRKEHDAYCSALREFCTARSLPYFRTHTGIPFDDLVLRIFRRGGFLR